MSWERTADGNKFFEDLERAFNTPTSQTPVLPQIKKQNTPKSTNNISGLKRHGLKSDDNDAKRRKVSAENNPTTGVGVRTRPVTHDKSKPNKKPLILKRRSEKSEIPKKLGNMLTGMILFFIPNSRKNGVRKYRMNLFAQHGADVRDCWNEDITHIICDKSITGERIMRELQWEQFPVSRFEIVADP